MFRWWRADGLELAAEDLSGLSPVPARIWDLRTMEEAVFPRPRLSFKSERDLGYLWDESTLTGRVRLGPKSSWFSQLEEHEHKRVRWFSGAYGNRLGTHLIEALQRSLAIGDDGYRKLTAEIGGKPYSIENRGYGEFRWRGTRDTGKTSSSKGSQRDRARLRSSRSRWMKAALMKKLEDRLEQAEWLEKPG